MGHEGEDQDSSDEYGELPVGTMGMGTGFGASLRQAQQQNNYDEDDGYHEFSEDDEDDYGDYQDHHAALNMYQQRGEI